MSCFLFLLLLGLAGPIERCYGSPLDLEDIEADLSVRLQSEDNDELKQTGQSKSLHVMFEDFVEKYNKVYLTPEEREKRLEIFSKNLKRYEEMNAADMGTAIYGPDQFSDLTDEEFKEKMLTFSPEMYSRGNYEYYDGPELSLNKKMPKNFNWADKGAVSPVKNQGFCGSCWAFSTVGNLEGLYYNKHKTMELFSEQQLVDCVTECGGCNGGWMKTAVEYIKDAGGLEKSSDYPYRGVDQTCSFNASKVAVKVKKNIMLPTNEKKMAKYLFKNGPISVALDASAMRGYKGGIAHPPETYCSKNETQVNHGVTLTGYGVYKIELEGKKKKLLPYWIIKNSWGTVFGSKGYYLLYRGDKSCAINSYPSSAVLA